MTAYDGAIKALVVEWSELLAQGRFADALTMFQVSEYSHSSIPTPEELAKLIAGYGWPEPYPSGEIFTLTPLLSRPDAEEVIRTWIQIDRDNQYGPEGFQGWIRYDLPLNGKRSFLTANFRLESVGADRMTLRFDALRVDWYEITLKYAKRTWDHESRLSSLPAEWQRELAALHRLESNVFNGAYLQFLSNCGRESYSYASRALKRIGALRTAAIVDLCQALVDEHFDCEGKSEDLAQLLPNPILGRDGQTIKEAGSVLPEPVIARIYELSFEIMNFPDDWSRLGFIHYRPYLEAERLSSGH
jgi:uncharacterized protein DUF4375